MIVNDEHKEDLIKVAKQFKYSAQSYPQDDKGNPTPSYLEYISIMYDPEAAKIVQHLPVFPKTLSFKKLSKTLNISIEELKSKLETPSKRGFIINTGKYLALPRPLFMHDMPFILTINRKRDDMVKFAELSRKYYTDEGYYKIWQNKRDGTPRMRVLTVSEEVELGHQILPIEEVYKLIDKFDTFSLTPCPCRVRTEVEGIRECKDKFPIWNCIQMGAYAGATLSQGDPELKSITKEEVKRITKEAAELGLVHATDNEANSAQILCACCGCCCGMLKGITKLGNPRGMAKANYVSTIDKEACTGCETCLSRCMFDAITVNDVAEVNPEKCMGCGVCAVTCPSDAITMERLLREEIPGATITE